MATKGHSRTFLFLQSLSTLLFLGLYAFSLYISYQKYGYLRNEDMILLLPSVLLLVLTFISASGLRIKHRSFAAEGEVIPFLFLLISMQGINFLPECYTIAGLMPLPPVVLVILGRFTFLSVSMLFVYCALLYMGLSISRLASNISISLIFVLIVSILIPINTNLISGIGNTYNINFFLAVVILNAIAIFSYFLVAITDNVNHDIKRAFTFLFLIVGNTLLIAKFTTYITTIIGAVFYTIGTIMLLVTGKDNF